MLKSIIKSLPKSRRRIQDISAALLERKDQTGMFLELSQEDRNMLRTIRNKNKTTAKDEEFVHECIETTIGQIDGKHWIERTRLLECWMPFEGGPVSEPA